MYTINQICAENRGRQFKREGEVNWCVTYENEVYIYDGQNRARRSLTTDDLRATDWIYEEISIQITKSFLESIWSDNEWNVDRQISLTGNETLIQLIKDLSLNE